MRTNPPDEAEEAMGFFAAPLTSTPEGRLAMAILQRAVLDLVTEGIPRQFAQCAQRWIDSDGEPHVFSFESVSELMSENPESLRECVRKFVRRSRSAGTFIRRVSLSSQPRGAYYVRRGCERVIRRGGDGS